MSISVQRCAECGSELPPNVPPGLCPGCALGRVMEIAPAETFAVPPSDGLTADQTFERRWAWAVMEEAIKKLAQEYSARGKTNLFEQLKELQPGEHGEKSYAGGHN